MVEYAGDMTTRRSRGAILPVQDYGKERRRFRELDDTESISKVQHGEPLHLRGLSFANHVDPKNSIVFEFLSKSTLLQRSPDCRILLRLNKKAQIKFPRAHGRFFSRTELGRALGSDMEVWIRNHRPTKQSQQAKSNRDWVKSQLAKNKFSF
ncbi:hypothetical protein F5Y06DRAFT_274155 [Hypoxylon sp. FL0890]|nr:hypothetical protein F5Y06DRAFT_274155 [Hypoxylon sp. FL0890]